MTSLILLTLLISAAATIILIIYLIDRINGLERLTLSREGPTAQTTAEGAADNSFLGLSGQLLWDAMAGKSPEGFNENDLIALKPRYEQLLRTHIERLFNEGVNDSQQGSTPKKPKVPIDITMLRGSVSSWIPPQHASAIYNAGFQSINAVEPERSTIRTSLDNASNLLYTRTSLALQQPFSALLMPVSEPVGEPVLEDLPQLNDGASSEDVADT
jgi:hypothetical protein|tara:strand:- start:25561 stop:26205 length:645 start_codon:yes stop_codon:yes gene_type:complete